MGENVPFSYLTAILLCFTSKSYSIFLVPTLRSHVCNYSHRGRHAEAAELWDPICSTYIQQGWTTVSINLIERLAICQKVIKQYTEYVLSCFLLIQNPQLIYLRSVDDYIGELNEYTLRMDSGKFLTTNINRN